uniref:Gamma-glutamylputrescine oxidoreductase n=1 Tax=Talaromyces marneffei PM1 TaxID=1077442 RepID=A0A093V3I1_TALMA
MSESDYMITFCTALAAKASLDPGLPVPNPTSSYWQSEPHELADHQSSHLPSSVDVVIIGSGMTGISVAYHLLQQEPNLRVTILEARSLTSGATGRNGGHCKEDPYDDYEDLKELYGKEGAKRVVKFRLAQLDALVKLVEELGEDAKKVSCLRRVDGLDAFYDEDAWERVKKKVEDYLEDFPEEKDVWLVHEGSDIDERFGTINAVGCITGPAGAMWPYKLVGAVITHISNKKHYPNLSIETHTPVESISSTESDAKHPFLLTTPRGDIKATNIIHCTNAFAAHLLPGLKGKIYPMRGQMTRQSAPPGFPRLGDQRSWILHYDFGYDYVTQSPPHSTSSSTDDIYLGGGFLKALVMGQVSVEDADVGSTRDDLQNPVALATLQDAVEKRLRHGNGTKIVDQWTGVMGFTIDNNPVVGKVPYEISQRKPADSQTEGREWIAAGFCGNGMVNCWLSGKGTAEMLLNGEEAVREWFPVDEYACSIERLQKMTLVDRFLEFVKDAV